MASFAKLLDRLPLKPAHISIPEAILPDTSRALLLDEPTALHIFDQMAALLSPGEYYYFVVDLPDMRLRYASDGFYDRLNLPEPAGLRDFLRRLSASELEHFKKKERLVSYFYEDFLDKNETLYYKTVYTIKIDNGRGEKRKFLHQSIPLEVDDQQKVNSALVVQVDVQHLMSLSTHYVNFIGTDGRPSYKHIDPESPNFEDPELKSFSQREIEVIARLSRGLTKEEIAEELNIAPSTVQTHRKNALKKSDATNINQLVANWVRKGWV